jgi:nitroreductase
MDADELLTTRASNGRLGEPAPDDDALEFAFAAAARSPDHGLLRPWRVQIVRGAAREALGDAFRQALVRREPAASARELDAARAKALRAPLLLVVSARLQVSRKVPRVEQVVSAGTAAQNMMLALHARGFSSMWRTGANAYDPVVKEVLGLAADDEIVGFLYCGTATAPAPPVERPDPASFVSEWNGPKR